MASKNITKVGAIVEMYKRCPPNQKKQFKEFSNKHAEYKKRVNKYPEKLPRIDWEFYRKNVRAEFIKMVDDFEQKYQELQKVFESRVSLDLSKYYVEVEQQRCEVECELKEFIAESNKRIAEYEAEIKRIKDMIPYEQMTIEEFIDLRPENAGLIPFGKKPLFWPFKEDEQQSGPTGYPEGTMKPPPEGTPDEPEPPEFEDDPRRYARMAKRGGHVSAQEKAAFPLPGPRTSETTKKAEQASKAEVLQSEKEKAEHAKYKTKPKAKPEGSKQQAQEVAATAQKPKQSTSAPQTASTKTQHETKKTEAASKESTDQTKRETQGASTKSEGQPKKASKQEAAPATELEKPKPKKTDTKVDKCKEKCKDVALQKVVADKTITGVKPDTKKDAAPVDTGKPKEGQDAKDVKGPVYTVDCAPKPKKEEKKPQEQNTDVECAPEATKTKKSKKKPKNVKKEMKEKKDDKVECEEFKAKDDDCQKDDDK